MAATPRRADGGRLGHAGRGGHVGPRQHPRHHKVDVARVRSGRQRVRQARRGRGKLEIAERGRAEAAADQPVVAVGRRVDAEGNGRGRREGQPIGDRQQIAAAAGRSQVEVERRQVRTGNQAADGQVPIEPMPPGAISEAAEATVTLPEIEPPPAPLASVPPLKVTVPLPVAEPLELLATRVPS